MRIDVHEENFVLRFRRLNPGQQRRFFRAFNAIEAQPYEDSDGASKTPQPARVLSLVRREPEPA